MTLHFLTSFLGTFAKLQRATISFFMSVGPPAWIISAPNEQSFMIYYILVSFKNMLRKFTFDSNLTRIMGALHEDICTFVTISRWILLRIRNISHKSCRENQNTHFMHSNFFFWKSCHVWDNVEKYGSAREATIDNVIWCLHFACWITRVTDSQNR